MGVDVVVGGSSEEIAVDDVWHLVCAWDGIFSRFRTDSELSRVNASAAAVVVVSNTFARALRAALRAARATDGLVDPTLGGALVAAGYDRDFAQLPGDAGPVDGGALGAWRSVSLTGRLLSRPHGVVLDLNGVEGHGRRRCGAPPTRRQLRLGRRRSGDEWPGRRCTSWWELDPSRDRRTGHEWDDRAALDA